MHSFLIAKLDDGQGSRPEAHDDMTAESSLGFTCADYVFFQFSRCPYAYNMVNTMSLLCIYSSSILESSQMI